jgi:hypothetical protein
MSREPPIHMEHHQIAHRALVSVWLAEDVAERFSSPRDLERPHAVW